MSTLTNHGKLRFMVFQRRFTTEVLLEFLHRLLRSVDRKVFLIVDRHPVHKAKKVERWPAERSDRIEVFFLPGYSPDPNPEEYLNNGLKQGVSAKPDRREKDEMRRTALSHMRMLQLRPDRVRKYFLHECINDAA